MAFVGRLVYGPSWPQRITRLVMKQVLRSDTLRRQLVVWLAAPLGVLWSISTLIDYDIANQFVTSAYDRSLLDSAIDIGKQIKMREGRIQAELPEVVLEMLVTGEPGKFFYLITGPQGEFIAGH